MNAPIGALRTRIHLERPTVAPDVSGGGVAWVEVGSAWACMHVGAADSAPTIRFELRAHADVRRGWRVALGDRRFRINTVRDVNDRGARLLLECEEEYQ